MIAMNTILVVNAGSSSVKFEVYRIADDNELKWVIKGQMDKAKALEAQLNSLNADRDDLQRKLGSATTDEERARIQAELDAKNAEIENMKKNPSTAATTKATAKPVYTGPAVTVPKKPQCHMLDGTKVASCAPGDSLCSCD